MPSIVDRLGSAAPALWVEVAPPRGINPSWLLKKLALLKSHVDAINLTDNALGRVKMSALVFAAMIKAQLGIPVVLNVSCRDRNLFALKSDLLGAGAIGVDAIVALSGDKISPSAGALPVNHLNVFGLLEAIAELNRGVTGDGRRPLKTLPRLIAGAVANPNRTDLTRELALLRRKAEAGAKFVITQPVFDENVGRAFLGPARDLGIKIVLGILPIKRESMAVHLRDKVEDLAGARGHLERYGGMSEEQVRRFSIDENIKLMRALSREVAGFNIMSGGGPSLAIDLALEFSRWRAATFTEGASG